MLATWKAEGVLWQAAPREFRFKAPQKGFLSPVLPLHPDPAPNAPVVEVQWGAAMLLPKPPLPVGPADTLDVKGAEMVLPNPDVLVPQLVVWVTAPKAETVSALKTVPCTADRVHSKSQLQSQTCPEACWLCGR